MKKLYEKYNAKYFASLLPELEIVIGYDASVYGYYDSVDEYIYISRVTNISRKALKSTLLHEMVHVWQETNELVKRYTDKGWHNKDFKEVVNYLEHETGLNIK